MQNRSQIKPYPPAVGCFIADATTCTMSATWHRDVKRRDSLTRCVCEAGRPELTASKALHLERRLAPSSDLC
jgi:predicted secreted Zn-dependent protease